MVDEGVDPAVREVVEVLEHLVVRRRYRQVQVGHRPDRTADVVRCEEQVVRIRPPCQTLHRQEAAVVRHVDLHDVEEALFDERADVLDGMRTLASGNRKACCLPHAPSCLGFSGGTGSSIHSGLKASRAAATRTAVDGVKRPCISIMICTSGPTASRTAATMDIARRSSAGEYSADAAPNGSSFNAR